MIFFASLFTVARRDPARHSTERGREANLVYKKLYASGNLNSRCLFEADCDGDFLWVNQSWVTITGLSEEDSLKEGWKRAILPGDLEQVLGAWADGVASGQGFSLTFRLLAANGDAYPVSCDCEIVKGESNDSEALIGALRFEANAAAT